MLTEHSLPIRDGDPASNLTADDPFAVFKICGRHYLEVAVPLIVTPAKAGVSGGGVLRWDMVRGGYTYIMTNKPRGVLYVGVTADIAARAVQHRNGTGSAFCKKYGLTRLVLVEPHDDITLAIAREKALKAWKREWKIRLVEESNPGWRDVSDVIF